MLTNRDIIITSIQSWDITIGSNIKNIAMELSKHNRVLFVNPPFNRLSVIRKQNRKRSLNGKKHDPECGLMLQRLNVNLWIFQPEEIIESISQLPINSLFDYLNKKNNIRFANEITEVVQHLGLKSFIHICDSDMFRSLHLKELLKPAMSVYYTRDNLMAVKYWQQQGLRIEPKHMAQADLVLANSTYLADMAKQYNRNSFFVGQGCDTTAFQHPNDNAIPEEFRDVRGPVIGYIGALKALRLDLSVLEHIARQRPNWNIVLVGPEDDAFQKSPLHSYPNVHFLGSKAEKDLPLYLSAFDVAINPQVLNEVTRGNYPRKIDEYLAMGKPVVATKTEAMGFFSDYVLLPANKSEWISSIESALQSTAAEEVLKRQSFASEHTWANNVQEIGRQIIRREQEIYTSQRQANSA